MIGVGDRVVCVDDSRTKWFRNYIFPNGELVSGEVYRVSGFWISDHTTDIPGELYILLQEKPKLHHDGTHDGWGACRFRKLEDHRNEQELAYHRSQPVHEPQPTP